MPVKNTKRRTNDGLEGVIAGLTEEEKKVLEDAGIGGGGSYTANPKLVKSDSTGNGGSYSPSWVGAKPIANKAYEVGQTFQTSYSYRWDPIAVQPNQIFIPTGATDVVSIANNTLKFGDVVLMLSECSSILKMSVSSDNKYTVEARNYLNYTVIKAGTTGDTITLPSSMGSASLNYQIYTLEVNKTEA